MGCICIIAQRSTKKTKLPEVFSFDCTERGDTGRALGTAKWNMETMLGSILLSHEVVPNFSGVASRRTVFELVLKIYREWQIIGICWNCQQIQDFQRYSRSNFVFQELNQNKIFCDGPLLLSVTITEPVITDQSKCCLRTQGMCSPLHWLETYRAEAFAKRQSVTARTRKEFENPRAKRRQEVLLNIKFT